MLDERADVLGPLAQRGHADVDHVEAVHEVFTEVAGSDRGSKMSLLVAAMTRTSTCVLTVSEPTGWISPFSRNRRNIACMRRLISATSSRKIVPWCACCSMPTLSR